LGLDYEHQAIIKDKFVVDFRLGNIILQCDGDYWHGHKRFEPLTERQLKQQKRDAAQDKYLQACGYTVIRVWECDMSLETLQRLLL
jgi:very-short-patch-repair endonuclease